MIRVRLRRRSDRGASAIEYAGLIVLAALVLAALLPLVPGRIGEFLPNALCRILHLGDAAKCKGTGPGGGEPTDIKPQWCLSSMQAYGFDVGWKGTIKKIIDLSIGRGYRIIRYDSREEDFDGKTKHFVYLAFVDKGDASIDPGKALSGKKIDLGTGVGGELQYGETYRMTPAQADQFTEDINRYQRGKIEHEVDGVPGAAVIANAINKGWPPAFVRHPAITYGQASGTGNLSIDGGIPLDKLPAPHKYVLPNGAAVSGEANKTLLTEHWNIYKDAKGHVLPATAVYHTTSGKLSYGVSRNRKITRPSTRSGKATANANHTKDYSSTTRVTTDDKTGDLKNIRYVITYGQGNEAGTQLGLSGKKPSEDDDGPSIGGQGTVNKGKLRTKVVQLNFDPHDPQQQAIGKEWLAKHGTEMPPSVANQILSDKDAAQPPGAGADPYDKLIFAKGIGWRTDADTTNKSLNINAQVPFEGGQIGPSLNFDSDDAKTKKAEILNRPGADGSRQWINYPKCTAAGNH